MELLDLVEDPADSVFLETVLDMLGRMCASGCVNPVHVVREWTVGSRVGSSAFAVKWVSRSAAVDKCLM